MPLNVNVVKASIAGVLVFSYDKFLKAAANMKAAGDGLLSFSSTLIADAVFSATTLLPSYFSVLGQYAQDIFAALLAAVLKPILRKKAPKYFPRKEGKQYAGMFDFKSFLVNLGANVMASYLEAPLRPMLPNFGGGSVVIG